MSTCQCPAAFELPDVPNMVCSESFGQIQKVAFQRIVDEDGAKNKFVKGSTGTPGNPITKKASWEAFLSARDETKIVVTPFINSPADAGGDARTTGGGNDDLGGVAEVLGGNPVNFTGSLRGVPQSIIKALKSLTCDSNVGNLGVYLFDENGNIEAIEDPATTGTFYPIPIRSFFVGDKIHGNYDGKDNNPIQWSYRPNYSDDLKIVAPEDFNPLTDLQNAE